MFFLFIVLWCWAIAAPARLVRFSLPAARQGKISPCYGAKISLPEDAGGGLPDMLSRWSVGDFRHVRGAGCEPECGFLPHSRGKSLRPHTEKYLAWVVGRRE